MSYVLFIWMLSGNSLSLESKEPPIYYELKACEAAARKAENAYLLFEGVVPEVKVKAYCTPRKISEQQ